jgi:catechol 2,3-dioxygenase-like lactoylglutathione lyase family enzyme
MRLIDLADNIYVGVTDTEAAARWYIEKLGMRRVVVSSGDGECVTLGFDKDMDVALALGPPGDFQSPTPILQTSNAAKAHELLTGRCVNVGPVEVDRQGTRYFVMKDVEGNEIEVAEMS